MRLLPWIALGGALGALARFGVGVLAVELLGPRLPWGTLLVNVAGSIALGVLMEWTLLSPSLSPGARALLTTGFLGAFTTFSTFSVETVRLLERGDLGWAAANLLGSVTLGLLGAAGGVAAARWWLQGAAPGG